MSRPRFLALFAPAAVVLVGCTDDLTVPTDTRSSGISLASSLSPNRNLEVILRPVGEGTGFGLVKFRQPKDDEAIVFLDTWVRDLQPNTSYQLQRATDATIDGLCTGSNWLTLGQGATPASIVTDEHGTGRQDLFRDLSLVPPGSAFDIYFRVIDPSQAVVLQSGCYQFVVDL